MKKIIFPFLSLLVCSIMACKSGDKKPKDDKNQPKSAVDSLLAVIDKGHMDGMGKIGRLHNTRKAVQATLDSMAKLPPAAQQAAKVFTDQLNAVIKDINDADAAMEKWMGEYKEDSAIDNTEARIIYLKGETQKVEMMTAAIHNSIQKADSLLKN